ncbi:unnamed protein product [Aphanomyces euteiches]
MNTSAIKSDPNSAFLISVTHVQLQVIQSALLDLREFGPKTIDPVTPETLLAKGEDNTVQESLRIAGQQGRTCDEISAQHTFEQSQRSALPRVNVGRDLIVYTTTAFACHCKRGKGLWNQLALRKSMSCMPDFCRTLKEGSKICLLFTVRSIHPVDINSSLLSLDKRPRGVRENRVEQHDAGCGDVYAFTDEAQMECDWNVSRRALAGHGSRHEQSHPRLSPLLCPACKTF